MAKKSKTRKKSAKIKVKKQTKKIKVMARKRSRVRTVTTRAGSYSRRAKGFLSGTTGKLVVGAVIGGIVPVVASRLAPSAAVLTDDASDLLATFIGGKWGLVGNMVGKRVVPMLLAQSQGNNINLSDYA